MEDDETRNIFKYDPRLGMREAFRTRMKDQAKQVRERKDEYLQLMDRPWGTLDAPETEKVHFLAKLFVYAAFYEAL